MLHFLKWYVYRYSFPHRGWKFLRAYMQRNNLDKKLFVKKIFNGSYMQLMPEDHVQQYLFWYGIYENETVKTFLQEIKCTDVFLDIGANVGYYSILAASKIKTGCIYSFEPNVQLHAQINESMRLNTFEKFEIVPFAVSKLHKQELELFLSEADNKGMSSLQEPENYSGLSKKITTITIDDWCVENNIEKIDIIKIDIEGAELDALMGMQISLLKHKPIIFIEVCNKTLNRFNVNATTVFEFIINMGYNAFAIQTNGDLIIMQEYAETIDFNIVFKPK